jgi:hypothetical protein
MDQSNDVTREEFMNMTVQEILQLRTVSKKWRNIIDEDSFWCRLIKRDYGVTQTDGCFDSYKVLELKKNAPRFYANKFYEYYIANFHHFGVCKKKFINDASSLLTNSIGDLNKQVNYINKTIKLNRNLFSADGDINSEYEDEINLIIYEILIVILDFENNGDLDKDDQDNIYDDGHAIMFEFYRTMYKNKK